MKPEDEAKDLVSMFLKIGEIDIDEAIQCAIIAVDKIIKSNPRIDKSPANWIDHYTFTVVFELMEENSNYYKEVKQELEKI